MADLTHGMCSYAYLKISKKWGWHFKLSYVEPTYVIFDNFHRFQGPPSPLRLGGRCCRCFFFWKNTSLDLLSMYFVDLVNFKRFQGPLVKKTKYGPSVQMTMPARRASKFYAKRRAASLPIFFLSLIPNTSTALTLSVDVESHAHDISTCVEACSC